MSGIRDAVDPIEFDGCRINIRETYDCPIAPAKILLDDLQKVSVEMKFCNGMYWYSLREYPESHHVE